MSEELDKKLEEFIEQLALIYTENRKLVDEKLTGDDLLKNENVQKCFIINSIMSSRENLEAGYVCWLEDNKDTKKFIDSYKIHFEKTSAGYKYTVDYVNDTPEKNN